MGYLAESFLRLKDTFIGRGLQSDKKYQRLIFVSGPARSGTTMLNRLLTGGRAHRMFEECNVITAALRAHSQTLFLPDNRIAQYFGSVEDANHVYREILERLISALTRDEPNKRILVLKDPYLLEVMRSVDELYPTTHVLFSIRSPIDTLASMKVVREKQGHEYDLRDDITYLDNYYTKLSQLALKYRSGALKKSRAFVSYENLCSEYSSSKVAIEKFTRSEVSDEPSASVSAEGTAFYTERYRGEVSDQSIGNHRNVFDNREIREYSESLAQAKAIYESLEVLNP